MALLLDEGQCTKITMTMSVLYAPPRLPCSPVTIVTSPITITIIMLLLFFFFLSIATFSWPYLLLCFLPPLFFIPALPLLLTWQGDCSCLPGWQTIWMNRKLWMNKKPFLISSPPPCCVCLCVALQFSVSRCNIFSVSSCAPSPDVPLFFLGCLHFH